MKKLTDRYKLSLVGFTARNVANMCFSFTVILSLRELHLSAIEIAAAFSLMPITALILDLPMGVLADQISLKTAVILASVMDLCGLAAFLAIGISPALLPLIFLFKGVGNALESGAYRLLVLDAASGHYEPGREAERRSSRDLQYAARFGSLLGLGVGFQLLHIAPRLPVVFCLIALIINIVLVAGAPSEGCRARKFSTLRAGATDVWGALRSFTKPATFAILIFTISEGFRNGTDQILFAPYMKGVFGSTAFLSIIPLISWPIRMFGTWFVDRVNVDEQHLPFAATASFAGIGIVLLIFWLFPRPIVAVFAMAAIFFCYSLREIWYDTWQLSLIRDNGYGRATSMSALSAISKSVEFFGMQTVAAFSLIDHPGTGYMWAGTVIVSGALLGIWLTLRVRSHSAALSADFSSPF